MSYIPTTWASGDKVTSTKMNKIEQGIADAGGGGYDLVIASTNPLEDLEHLTTSDLTVVSGDVLDAEAKVINGDPVNAVFMYYTEWSYTPSSSNSNALYDYLSVTGWDTPSRTIFFSATRVSDAYTDTPSFRGVAIEYDADDGSFTHYLGKIQFL